MKADISKNRGARRYVDVTREGQPRFPGDPNIEDNEELDIPDLEESDEERFNEPEGEAVPVTPSRTPVESLAEEGTRTPFSPVAPSRIESEPENEFQSPYGAVSASSRQGCLLYTSDAADE